MYVHMEIVKDALSKEELQAFNDLLGKVKDYKDENNILTFADILVQIEKEAGEK